MISILNIYNNNTYNTDILFHINNNKISWVLKDKQEVIDICEVIYKGARKGKGLVVAPKDYSTRYKY